MTSAADPRDARLLSLASSTSLVFPIAALVLSLLTFLTMPPTPAIVGILAVSLLPWALVAGGVRIHPLVVVLVTMAATAWLVIRLDDQATLFLGVVTSSWAAARGLRSASIVAVGGFSAVSIGCDIGQGKSTGWIIWATGMAFGWFAGHLLFRQQALTAQLEAARSDLAVAAADHERRAIAREVHDIVGHSLTVVLLNIAGARRHLATNPAAAVEAMERAEAISRESLETVRSVVGLLSSNSDSQRDAPLPGGRDVLPLLDQAATSGLPVKVSVTGDPEALEPAIGLTVVRLFQEALANASRHATGETVDVGLAIHPSTVTVTVSNPLRLRAGVGAGAETPGPTRSGVGIASMTDRVAAVHGTLDVGAHDGHWIVRAVLPRSMHSRAELSTA